MEEMPPPPPESGTKRDFASMLNQYIPKKKKKSHTGFSPWTKMAKSKKEGY